MIARNTIYAYNGVLGLNTLLLAEITSKIPKNYFLSINEEAYMGYIKKV